MVPLTEKGGVNLIKTIPPPQIVLQLMQVMEILWIALGAVFPSLSAELAILLEQLRPPAMPLHSKVVFAQWGV